MHVVPSTAHSASPDVCVEALQIRKSYGSRRVLEDVNFTIRRGERVALTGPSGSGKTSLLNCVGGIDRPDSGRIALLGQALDGLDDAALTQMRRRTVGTIFQFFHLLPTLTAAENIELPLQLNGVTTRERAERVGELLDRVGVRHRADALPSQLSGGEMQRIAIARALAHRPPVLLADEPTGNLDSSNGASVLELLVQLSEETQTAILLVTHSDEVAAVCHRRLHLRDGRLDHQS